jgi:sugar phosphate isomerase/epimerase
MTTRRDFVRTSTTAIAAAALPWPPFSSSPSGPLDRIGVQLYTVRSLLERDFEGTLQRIAEIGFQEVEFAGYFRRPPRQIRSLLQSLKLDAPGGHMPYEALAQPGEWDRVLEMANELGHRYVVIAWTPASDRRTLDDWKRIAERFNAAGRAARRAGLTFAYHNHEFEFTPLGAGPLPFDVLLTESDPELVKIELDLYWITLGGQDPLEYFRRQPGRFPLVHVKDMQRGGEQPRMVDVGAGDIDFAAIFAERERAGIRHFFVEHDEPAAPLDSIRASYQHLRAMRR